MGKGVCVVSLDLLRQALAFPETSRIVSIAPDLGADALSILVEDPGIQETKPGDLRPMLTPKLERHYYVKFISWGDKLGA